MNLLIIDFELNFNFYKEKLPLLFEKSDAQFAQNITEVTQYLYQTVDLIICHHMPSKYSAFDLMTYLSRFKPEKPMFCIVVVSETTQFSVQLALDAGITFIVEINNLTETCINTLILNHNNLKTMSKLKKADAKLREIDSLTQLPNRHAYDEKLSEITNLTINQEHEILMNTHPKQAALLVFDIDNFKGINDTYGHSVGDFVLKIVSSRVVSILRNNEFFARLGGDEFSLILEDSQSGKLQEEMYVIAQRIIDTTQNPIEIKNFSIQVTLSIGCALFNKKMTSITEFYQAADIAMYSAKRNGKNKYTIYDEIMRLEHEHNITLTQEITIALDQKNLAVHYLPVLTSCDPNKLVGVEALVRLNLYSEIINPPQFLSIAENNGLIISIGRQVLVQAMEQLARWNRLRSEPLILYINLSFAQLNDFYLSKFLDAELARLGISAEHLVFDIPESAYTKASTMQKQTLINLENIGCSLCLDDVGSGCFPVYHLMDLPVKFAKIDAKLISEATVSQAHLSILKALISLLTDVGYGIIAKGVETSQQLKLCQQLAIPKTQGFFHDVPQSAQTITERWQLSN